MAPKGKTTSTTTKTKVNTPAKKSTIINGVETDAKKNGWVYWSFLPPTQKPVAGPGTNVGFNKPIIPLTNKKTVVTKDYSKDQSKVNTPINKYTQETLNKLKGNTILPTIPGQNMTVIPKKTNPISSSNGIASGPNQNMSTVKNKTNPISLKNSSNMFEALPGYSDPFGSVFKQPNYSNAMSAGKSSSSKWEQYASQWTWKQVDPRTQRAMEAKLVASGKNSTENSAALKEQLDSLWYDSSFLKADYSNYSKNLLDQNRMSQTNKLKGQNSDPETARLLASFWHQSKTSQQKLAELSALLSRKGDKDAEKNAQILLSNLNTTNQSVKDSYNIDANKALAGAWAMADIPMSTIPTTAAKPVSTEPMMSVAPTEETPTTPAIPNLGGFTPDYSGFKAPEKTTPTEPMQTVAPTTTPVTAPNGKNYKLTKTDDGRVGFVNINGEMQYFQNYDAAVGYINKNNPTGSKGGDENVLNKSQPGETLVVEEDIDAQDNNKLITKQVEEYDASSKTQVDRLVESLQTIINEWKKSEYGNNENRSANMGILAQGVEWVKNLYTKIDWLTTEVSSKALELFDRSSMRSANARAQQMADKGYLTSDQVAQVANYSVADYKRDVDIKRVDVEKQIAEKKIELAQSQEKLLNDIRANQMTTNDAKLAQINFVTKQFADVMSTFQDKEDQVKQFYDTQSAAVQALATQANVSANSIIQNDDATNQAQQNNKARAGSDDTARVNYILSRIPDQNLHKYAMQAIDTLIKNNKFMSPNVEYLAAQVATAANALQQRDLKALK